MQVKGFFENLLLQMISGEHWAIEIRSRVNVIHLWTHWRGCCSELVGESRLCAGACPRRGSPFEAREVGRQACPERSRRVIGLFESLLAEAFNE